MQLILCLSVEFLSQKVCGVVDRALCRLSCLFVCVFVFLTISILCTGGIRGFRQALVLFRTIVLEGGKGSLNLFARLRVGRGQ